ncbi:MAG TPA: hypothetical protein VFH08_14395 [Chitinophagaceae bacterium]|nr:hypothetical protein [Chitinophagaceae bacterium]
MENTKSVPYGRISLFFVFILALVTWGFYKTYLIFFPSFTGFNNVQHFHGAMMMTWMAFLIIQPLLIRSGKTNIHRLIGKFSYVIAPLLVVSIFLVSRMVYQRPVPAMPEEERIGLIALSIPGMIAFAALYLLAIITRKNTSSHLRYMIGTSLLLVGPGLGRALIVYYNMSLNDAVNFTNYLVMAIAAGLLINDLIKRRTYVPYTVILITILLTHFAWNFRYSIAWQSIGETFAKIFF